MRKLAKNLRILLAAMLACACSLALGQDYEREARWAKETLATLVVGEAVQIEQKNGHRFLGLYTYTPAFTDIVHELRGHIGASRLPKIGGVPA